MSRLVPGRYLAMLIILNQGRSLTFQKLFKVHNKRKKYLSKVPLIERLDSTSDFYLNFAKSICEHDVQSVSPCFNYCT